MITLLQRYRWVLICSAIFFLSILIVFGLQSDDWIDQRITSLLEASGLIGGLFVFLAIVLIIFPILFRSLSGEGQFQARAAADAGVLEDKIVERLRSLIAAQVSADVDIRVELEKLIDSRVTSGFIKKVKRG
jgi:hypothetical protein